MSKTTRFLVAGAIVPTLAFALALPVAAAEQSGSMVVAQASTDGKPDPKKDDPKKKPAAQPAKPQPPAAAAPSKPQPPAASAPAKPAPTTAQPPAASKPPQQPAAREPSKPQHPTAAQPSPPSPSSAGAKPATHEAKPHPSATAQPSSTPSPGTDPSKPQHPAARDRAKPQPSATAQPPASSHPSTAAKPTTQPPPPTAAKPVTQPPPSTTAKPATQPGTPGTHPPTAAAQPGTTPPSYGGGKPTATATPVAPSKPVVPTPPPTRAAALESVKHAQEWRSRRIADVQSARVQSVEGGRTIIREPDRTIVVEGGRPIIRHSEVDRIGFGARDMNIERHGGDTWAVVERPGGIRIITVVDADGRLLRRIRRDAAGREIFLIDNTFVEPEQLDSFYLELAPPVVRIPRDRYIVEVALADAGLIYDALIAPPVEQLERRYALDEVRFNPLLLDRMPRVDIDTITFETGSWAIGPDQVDRLAVIAEAINRVVARNPREMFLIEGHTDAVGSDVDNLSLSDRRAESVATVLSEQFQVPPENLTSQGYGKQYLKIPTDGPERRNRRVTVRRITPLLTGMSDAEH
jgi:outer membrane protein OmpA-like peptidoglycan-associated protein